MRQLFDIKTENNFLLVSFFINVTWLYLKRTAQNWPQNNKNNDKYKRKHLRRGFFPAQLIHPSSVECF